MKKYILSIDQGTTSTRCFIFDRRGIIIGSSQKEHQQIYPQPGWVEHDPLEIWQNTQEVISKALISASINHFEISAIGITNQRETTVLWDRRTGKPFYNAIVWQDTRTKDICMELSSIGGQDRFRQKVGLPITTYFSGPKIIWLLRNGDQLLHKAISEGNVLFGTIDTWLIWWLTGGPQKGIHVTDVTNASRTMLMDLESLDWDQQILSELEIPATILPRIIPSSDPEAYGVTDVRNILESTIPICGNLGDQQAALVGQTCFTPGEAKNTYGTGCFTLLNTGNKGIQSRFGLLTTLAYQFGDTPPVYALEGSIAIAGALVHWLRDNIGLIQSSDDIEALANTVKDNGDVYFVPAFSGLYAPYWRSDARGAIVGLTRYVNKGHIARAALEATAFQTREVIDAMEKDSNVDLKDLRVDGGMVKNELLMQFQADILGVPVVRPVISEISSLGAAYAAGLAVGFWNDLDELKQLWTVDRVWKPKMEPEMAEKIISRWLKAVERTFNWVE